MIPEVHPRTVHLQNKTETKILDFKYIKKYMSLTSGYYPEVPSYPFYIPSPTCPAPSLSAASSLFSPFEPLPPVRRSRCRRLQHCRAMVRTMDDSEVIV